MPVFSVFFDVASASSDAFLDAFSTCAMAPALELRELAHAFVLTASRPMMPSRDRAECASASCKLPMSPSVATNFGSANLDIALEYLDAATAAPLDADVSILRLPSN